MSCFAQGLRVYTCITRFHNSRTNTHSISSLTFSSRTLDRGREAVGFARPHGIAGICGRHSPGRENRI